MTFEFTDRDLAILVVVKLFDKLNTTDLLKILNKGYTDSNPKLIAIKVSRPSIEKRLIHLVNEKLLEMRKDRTYIITKEGRERINKEKDKNATLVSVYSDLFKTQIESS